MTFEIMNPSDPYSIDGEREVVCAAVLLLGSGWYAVEGADGERVLPILALCPGDRPEAWWRETFGRELVDSLSALKPQIAEALASVRLGRPGEKAPRERSSLRDIGGMAHRMAESLRASKEKEDAT